MAVVTRRDDEARHEPLDVPLKRRRQRLVEIVEIEDDSPVWRRDTPKFDRCASPQHCTRNPVVAVRERSHAMIAAPPR
jgi:hypothetical protein